MAWALEFNNGVTGERATLATPYVLQVGDTITYSGKFVDAGNTFNMFLNFYNPNTFLDFCSLSGGALRIRIDGTQQTGSDIVTDGDNFIASIERTSSGYTCSLNGVEQYTINKTVDIDPLLGFGNSGTDFILSGQLYYCSIVNSSTGLVHNWSSDDSDHNSLILTDTVGGNDATLVNMTTANWIDLGGGGVSLMSDALMDVIDLSSQSVRIGMVSDSVLSIIDGSVASVSVSQGSDSLLVLSDQSVVSVSVSQSSQALLSISDESSQGTTDTVRLVGDAILDIIDLSVQTVSISLSSDDALRLLDESEQIAFEGVRLVSDATLNVTDLSSQSVRVSLTGDAQVTVVDRSIQIAGELEIIVGETYEIKSDLVTLEIDSKLNKVEVI